MSKDFLGRGWRFPVGPGSDGKIALADGEDDIREAIEIIIGTEKGERTMRPDFGCALRSVMFDAIDTATLTRIGYIVKDALLRNEPRIEVVRVTAMHRPAQQAGPAGGGDDIVDIEIKYRVRSTNNVFNMVYPYYLG